MGSGPNRRRVLIGAGATAVVAALAEHVLGLSPAFAGAAADQTNESFAADHVRKLAEELSAREFVKPRLELPEPFNALTAEQYRDIRFRSEASVWRGENLDYEVQLLALGWLYETPVEVWIVEGGKARSLKADSASFAIGPSIEKAPDAAPFGFSGFRVSGTLTGPMRSTSSSRFKAQAISRPSAAASSTACPHAALRSTRHAPAGKSSRFSAHSGSRSRRRARARS